MTPKNTQLNTMQKNLNN